MAVSLTMTKQAQLHLALRIIASFAEENTEELRDELLGIEAALRNAIESVVDWPDDEE